MTIKGGPDFVFIVAITWCVGHGLIWGGTDFTAVLAHGICEVTVVSLHCYLGRRILSQ